MRTLVTALLAVTPIALFPDDLDVARKHLRDGETEAAVAAVEEALKRDPEDVVAQELYGEALLEAGRRDEAAHWLETALAAHSAAGRRRETSRLEKLVAKADRLAKKRKGLLAGLGRDLTRAAEKLHESGQDERAYELLLRARPFVDAKLEKSIAALVEEITSVDAVVDLDAAGGGEEGGLREAIEIETEHYDLVCNLERPVVELLAVTVEDIFSSYVQIYFEGNERKAPALRPTVRIHGTWEDMVALWPGTPSPGLGGWWSPGSQEIHTYDGRTRGSSLEGTLLTILHEASHQFMSAATRGAGVPSWFNEGTACFFEGSTAMADGRVLWPDAAYGRLRALVYDMQSKSADAPTPVEVIGYAGHSSYPGHYYHHGWGFVYFLQQWEDPETLAYAYRPLYIRYLEESTGNVERTLEIFEDVFLGPDSPLGHATFDDFVVDWRRWILETVAPLHMGKVEKRRELRMARGQRYLAAAAIAAEQKKKAVVSEEEFLLRALGDFEYVRKHVDAEGEPSQELLLALADVLERLDRKKTAAAMVESVLNLVDEGKVELPEEEYSALEKRLEKLDRANFALRSAKAAERRHVVRLRNLLEEYAEKEPDHVLRAYTFAADTSRALGEPPDWIEIAGELRGRARELDRLLGRVFLLSDAKKSWGTVMTARPESFDVGRGSARLEAVRPAAMIDQSVEAKAPYEVRARIERAGEAHLGSAFGLVVSGTEKSDWLVVGVDDEGALRLWRVYNSREGGTRIRSAGTLAAAVSTDHAIELTARVRTDGMLEVRVNGGEPVEAELPFELPVPTHVGIFARDSDARFEGLVLEIFS